MVKEEAEEVITVSSVLLGVQNVSVPEGIHRFGGNNNLTARHAEKEKPLVLDLRLICLLTCPTLALLGVHELELDAAQVEILQKLLDLTYRLVGLPMNNPFQYCLYHVELLV